MACQNCNALTPDSDPCEVCRRDPATNNCAECKKHLSGIAYPFVCGECIGRHAGARSVPTKSHKWDRGGERCLNCGAKDWMGGPCS